MCLSLKSTLQPSSHNLPMDLSDELSRAGKIFAVLPVTLIDGGSGRRP